MQPDTNDNKKIASLTDKKKSSLYNDANSLDDFLEDFNKWENDIDNPIAASQEDSRSLIVQIVFFTYAAILILNVLGIYLFITFGDLDRAQFIQSIVLEIFAHITPVVTFVLGFYFATKSN